MRLPRSMTEVALLMLFISAALAGCGPGTASHAAREGLLEEYVDPAGPGGTTTLLLYEDGGFQLRHCPRELRDSDAPSDLVAEGEWERSEGVLLLSTSDWEAMFVSAIVSLRLHDRGDTLRGFQWMQSSSETPVDTCRFVLRSEFADFIYPLEGSGTRQAGW